MGDVRNFEHPVRKALGTELNQPKTEKEVVNNRAGGRSYPSLASTDDSIMPPDARYGTE